VVLKYLQSYSRRILFRETVDVFVRTIRNTQIHSVESMQSFCVLKKGYIK
jgi:hypothetical protein